MTHFLFFSFPAKLGRAFRSSLVIPCGVLELVVLESQGARELTSSWYPVTQSKSGRHCVSFFWVTMSGMMILWWCDKRLTHRVKPALHFLHRPVLNIFLCVLLWHGCLGQMREGEREIIKEIECSFAVMHSMQYHTPLPNMREHNYIGGSWRLEKGEQSLGLARHVCQCTVTQSHTTAKQYCSVVFINACPDGVECSYKQTATSSLVRYLLQQAT